MDKIKPIQLSNLIVYLLLMTGDNSFSDLSYISEKFDRIFINRNININLKLDYINSNKILLNKIKNYNNRWSYNINDKDFLVTYFTQKMMHEYDNIDRSNYDNIETQHNVVKVLIETYNYFFDDYSSIITEDMSYLLHFLLKKRLEQYIENNDRLFKLLQLI